MHAIRQHVFGGPEVLVLESLPDLRPGPGQLRIAVRASGVHLIDTTIRSGGHTGSLDAPKLPMTPGREVAGVVDLVGEGVEPAWLGRRVVTHLGAASGGYAEQAVAEAERVHPIGDTMAFDTAVAAIGTGRTAAAILDHISMDSDDTVLVTSAAGGLGVLFVQAARHAGAVVAGVAGGPAKLAVARRAGADVVADYRRPGWAERVRAAVGEVSLVLDGVGGEVARTAYGLLRAGGTFVQHGWSSGEGVALPGQDRTVVNVLGPDLMSRPLAELEAEALAAAADGSRVPLVGSRYFLAHAAEAHRALQERLTHGKVVLVTGGPPSG